MRAEAARLGPPHSQNFYISNEMRLNQQSAVATEPTRVPIEYSYGAGLYGSNDHRGALAAGGVSRIT
jgi:hypothetical protein